MEKLITLTNLQKYDEKIKKHTKDYTDAKVAELVGGAPELLDTLEELALALGENENFATTVAESIGKKADITELDNYLPLDGGGTISGTLGATSIITPSMKIGRTLEESVGLTVDSNNVPTIKTSFTQAAQRIKFLPNTGDGVILGIPPTNGTLALTSEISSQVNALSTKIQDGTVTAHAAAHDSAGNNIAATYAPISAPNFTGSIGISNTSGGYRLSAYTGDIPLFSSTATTYKIGFMRSNSNNVAIYTFPDIAGKLALLSEVSDLETKVARNYATKTELNGVSNLLTYATDAEVEALFS